MDPPLPVISSKAREALSLFCQRRGLNARHFLESLIWDRLEDEMDVEIAEQSRDAELIDFEELRSAID